RSGCAGFSTTLEANGGGDGQTSYKSVGGKKMRFLLALLIACLAIPALATPHCAEPVSAPMPAHDAMAMDHAHRGHDPMPATPMPAKSASAHGCIGCIPPSFTLARFAAPYRHVLELRHDRTTSSLVTAAAPQPETPPPKTLA
ncbi:MAG TPA: hypothetical protein VF509_10755, partial [Sphingobium sp.]